MEVEVDVLQSTHCVAGGNVVLVVEVGGAVARRPNARHIRHVRPWIDFYLSDFIQFHRTFYLIS